MTRLRICIGLIASALLVGVIPAHAGTTFRTAKVCAQTQSGIKITGVKFTWTFPGTIGGFGTTDKKGCFEVKFLPIGEVTFSQVSKFNLNFKGSVAPRRYQRFSQTVQTEIASTIKLVFLDPIGTTRIIVQAKDPSGASVRSTFQIETESHGENPVCALPAERMLVGLVTDLTEDQLFESTEVHNYGMRKPPADPLPSNRNWTQGIVNPNNYNVLEGTLYLHRLTYRYRERRVLGTGMFKFVPCTANAVIRATATSGLQAITASQSVLSDGLVEVHYNEFLQGFKNLPATLKAKSGKVTLTTTLHDNENQPISGTPVTVSESRASTPNISKKVGSCKPVLTATTNAQGKATFTLCPTKNTTVTVNAPPLGIVSQSITVTK